MADRLENSSSSKPAAAAAAAKKKKPRPVVVRTATQERNNVKRTERRRMHKKPKETPSAAKRAEKDAQRALGKSNISLSYLISKGADTPLLRCSAPKVETGADGSIQYTVLCATPEDAGAAAPCFICGRAAIAVCSAHCKDVQAKLRSIHAVCRGTYLLEASPTGCAQIVKGPLDQGKTVYNMKLTRWQTTFSPVLK